MFDLLSSTNNYLFLVLIAQFADSQIADFLHGPLLRLTAVPVCISLFKMVITSASNIRDSADEKYFETRNSSIYPEWSKPIFTTRKIK